MVASLYNNRASFAPLSISDELANLTQWVGWKYKPRTSGKPGKVPINPHTGKQAKSDNPGTWGTYEEAARCADERDLDGIGFMLTEDDPIVFIDLDSCRNPETGKLAPWAAKIIKVFDSYAEVSPSGTGVHIYVRGRLPGPGRNTTSVEMYDRERYFTFTGETLGAQDAIQPRQGAVEGLYARITRKGVQEVVSDTRKAVKVPVGDAELIEKARKAANGPKFCKLYDQGDISDHDSDESRADLALMGILAYWTGRDGDRMERMFTTSALGRRGKWTNRPDYRRSTIEKAVNGCARIYEGRSPKSGARTADDEIRQFLDRLRAEALIDPWIGRSGPGERWAFHALIDTGGVYGKLCDDGLIVAAAERDLALKCGSHQQSVGRLLGNLEERGRIRCIEKGRGAKASKYLLPRHVHKEESREQSFHLPRHVHKETFTHPHCVYRYDNGSAATLTMALARVRNAPTQTDKTFDRNGRKITQESEYLLRPMGDSGALLVEKVAAWPGMTLPELSTALGRAPSKVKRILNPVVEGGFVFEKDGRHYAPEDLIDRLLDHLEHAGCNDRQKSLKDRYEGEQRDNALRVEATRLYRVGLSPEEIAEKLGVGIEDVRAVLFRPDRVQTSETIRDDAPAPDDAPIITDAGDPAQFKTLAAMMRDYIAEGQAQKPPPAPSPKERIMWPCDLEKAAFYSKARERWAEKCQEHEEKTRAEEMVAVYG